jgi:UDP-N-acetylglucosamine/UDP-N-acetylgalactosamine diphosphorylase
VLELAAKKATDASRTSLPVYVMTSDLNDAIIREFFESRSFFGYKKEDVYFFEQGLEPCLSLNGKLILDSEMSLAMAPDGNGGIFNALQRTGALSDMASRGVAHLHIYGIDNVLTKAADPTFIGLCLDRQAQCGNKVCDSSICPSPPPLTHYRIDIFYRSCGG